MAAQIAEQQKKLEEYQKLFTENKIAPPKVKFVKPKVGIIGTIKMQFTRIAEEFSNHFEFIEILGSRIDHGLPNTISYIVVLCNMVPSPQRAIIKAHMQKLGKEDRMILVNGVTQACDRLRSFTSKN